MENGDHDFPMSAKKWDALIKAINLDYENYPEECINIARTLRKEFGIEPGKYFSQCLICGTNFWSISKDPRQCCNGCLTRDTRD